MLGNRCFCLLAYGAALGSVIDCQALDWNLYSYSCQSYQSADIKSKYKEIAGTPGNGWYELWRLGGTGAYVFHGPSGYADGIKTLDGNNEGYWDARTFQRCGVNGVSYSLLEAYAYMGGEWWPDGDYLVDLPNGQGTVIVGLERVACTWSTLVNCTDQDVVFHLCASNVSNCPGGISGGRAYAYWDMQLTIGGAPPPCLVNVVLMATITGWPTGDLLLKVGGVTEATIPIVPDDGVLHTYTVQVDVAPHMSPAIQGVEFEWVVESTSIADGVIVFDGACDSDVEGEGMISGSGVPPIGTPDPPELPTGEGDTFSDQPQPNMPDGPDVQGNEHTPLPNVDPDTPLPTGYVPGQGLGTQGDAYSAIREALKDHEGEMPAGSDPGASGILPLSFDDYGDAPDYAGGISSLAKGLDSTDRVRRKGRGWLSTIRNIQLPTGIGTTYSIGLPLPDLVGGGVWLVDLVPYQGSIELARAVVLLGMHITAFFAVIRIIRKGIA